MKRISFQNSAAIIEVPDCPEFLATLRAAAADWPFAETNQAGLPVATIRKAAGSYEIIAPGEEPLDASAVSAACSALVDAVDGLIKADPSRLCLHCGSVLMNGRLVIFPSHTHAGKSTLVARLAASGHMVFGDDILPLSADDAQGIGLGIAPRLRMPLPPTSNQAFRAFVKRRSGPGDGRYLFLDLLENELARRGQQAPLGAIVLLCRRPAGPAYFTRATRSAVLQTLVNQNFSGETSAERLLDRLHAVMDRLPRVTLNYSDLDDAVALLEAAFAAWPPDLAELPEPEENPPRLVAPGDEDLLQVDGADVAALPSADRAMIRKPGIELRSIDGDLFLAGCDGAAIYHLNMVGAALWNLLAEPVSRNDAVDALCLAFPGVEPEVVERDVARIFASLLAARLIH